MWHNERTAPLLHRQKCRINKALPQENRALLIAGETCLEKCKPNHANDYYTQTAYLHRF
ncbi:hypothetical protein T09_3668 [Trichinella sp. T9]|uniref:Uncharacterized protein n=1 Tax=Trichinella murrelli TaxID=144512 RepID=A0A0V0SSL1_9BILA|nr:hypothetical protein T05_1190 [Trichinella murrelli]KRX31609.1 hypothetical protein T09_3668 [Trichinella sp. T9]